MKDAKNYGMLHEGTFLTDPERTAIKMVIKEICDNHPNDEWWKIAGSIQGLVNSTLIYREVEELNESDTL